MGLDDPNHTPKPREFDLYFVTDDDETISPYDASICENSVPWKKGCGWAEPNAHVIEYSAYEQATAEIAELKARLQKQTEIMLRVDECLDRGADQRDALKSQLAVAVEALVLRLEHDTECDDQFDDFGPNETCECGAIVAQRAYAKLTRDDGSEK